MHIGIVGHKIHFISQYYHQLMANVNDNVKYNRYKKYLPKLKIIEFIVFIRTTEVFNSIYASTFQ